MDSIIVVDNLTKTYETGFRALKGVSLSIRRGEIFALLGPNGAGKTTMISIICGLVNASSGRVLVDGYDNVREYRKARSRIGLVPQELTNNMFDSVWATVRLSRGLFGKPRNDALLEQILRELSLWDKRHERIMALSGGMKRRVLIAKALAHEPEVLFLDEPTAGVDVELRRDMWNMVRRLQQRGVTIILTTHYIEEAEEMADRIGVIRQGELILTEDKNTLMQQLGTRQLTLQLQQPLEAVPEALAGYPLVLAEQGHALVYTFDAKAEQSGIAELLKRIDQLGIEVRDLHSSQSSLEDIFVGLVHSRAQTDEQATGSAA
ncbi:ABC transporter ATP-binding protein [Halopseudomonas aestusnigri]|uniref:ABC transporter ATP-binding protein n=1 Tax=Halopseudomonas TaxID=2901189 RepID=UPI000C8ED7E6|nr:ABC transporter ATP-binding protein [Halopseudomonas aestusnigri]MAH00674.1 multidrug ABC transporter ATP-binding protein [Pseudomonadales bacterium]HBT56144.1 multidrug ABC transporter ATP-binding protein [Pseudomonas sp.]MAK73227.1 multidrug ABC transporter ATP-binding protein [Pseudomonadales bacterium]MAP77239.1 multidrug ABC transporter ATP-binding protein [Pseudomonadales bacterium]MCC4261267.1 ABC transporter ATP-binding protein [Halopseudomonas aestusnigri]